MRLVGGAPDGKGGTLSVAASTAYDVYIAYWSDLSGNWAIRAGLQPGTTGAPLPGVCKLQHDDRRRDAGHVCFQRRVGCAASRQSDRRECYCAMDSNSNPFLDVTPNSPANSTRNMFLGLVGTVTSGSQPGAAANEIRVWFDDLPSQGSGGQRRSWFDGLAFVPAGTNVFWTADLDRTNGTLSLTNDTSESFTVAGYSILSAAGSLNGSGVNNAPWNNLTAGTLPGFTDNDNDWAVVGTPTALNRAAGAGRRAG